MLSTRVTRYFKEKAFQSSTARQLHNPKWIKWREANPDKADELFDQEHFRIGAALDHLLTQPGDFHEYYSVLPEPRFTGKMQDFIKLLPANITPEFYESDPEIQWKVEAAIQDVGFSWTAETVMKKFWGEEKYWEFYKNWHEAQTSGKTVLGKDEMEKVNRMGATITNNRHLMKWFVPTKGKTWYQVPLYTEINGVKCKCLIDMLHLDEKGNLWPIDLKTTGRGVWNFPRAFLYQRYYIQAGLYYAVLQKGNKYIDEVVIDHPQGEEILRAIDAGNLMNFSFIAIGTADKDTNEAIHWTCRDEDMSFALYGGRVDGTEYKGILELIEDYQWHEEQDFWELPRILEQNEGSLALDIKYDQCNKNYSPTT